MGLEGSVDPHGPAGSGRAVFPKDIGPRTVTAPGRVEIDQKLPEQSERQQLHGYHLEQDAGDEGGMIANRKSHHVPDEHPEQQARPDQR
jgi:hypothetical protein